MMDFTEFEFKRPRLKDKIYGELVWNDWDDEDDNFYWYGRIKDETGEEIEIVIYAESSIDFLAVGRTHSIYKRLIENLAQILDKTIEKALKDSLVLFKKARQRISAENTIKKKLRLHGIKIYSD